MNVFNIIKNIKNWKYKDLKNWLKDLSVQECWLYDWKVGIDLDSKSIRRTFCAFANTNGGLIFFGVSNKKDIKGVKEDPELRTKVSQIIDNNILPPIPISNWDIFTIKIPRRKLVVYILYILPSLYFERPHVTEHKIYIRRNGENWPINDGYTIRKYFLIEKFQPEHIKHLNYELNKIRDCKFNPDLIDFMYLKQLKEYLEMQMSKSREYGELLDILKRIVKLYEKIKKRQSIGLIAGQNISILDSDHLIMYYSELDNLIDNFYKKFREVHGL